MQMQNHPVLQLRPYLLDYYPCLCISGQWCWTNLAIGLTISQIPLYGGDPKTKFLLLFLSAVRPSVRPKTILLTLPLSDLQRLTWGQSYTDFYILGQIYKHVIIFALKCKNLYRTVAKSGEVFYGRSVCRSEGGQMTEWNGGRRTADGGRRTADGRKFLPLFRTALLNTAKNVQIYNPQKLSTTDIY